jgi:hypothetical protein
MTSDDYWNTNHPLSQAQKLEELKHEKQTFLARAQADADLLNQGRFAKENQTEIISSKGPPTYPRQPENSPFASNPVPPGDEDKLGYSIEDVEPVILPTLDPPLDPSGVDRAGTEGEVGVVPSSTSPSTPNQPTSLSAPCEPDVAVGGGGGKASAQPSRKPWRRL